jgi:hypothetical protein
LHRNHFTASFSALEASAPYPLPKHGDGRLWAIALGLSLLGNVLIFAVAGFATFESEKWRKKFPQDTPALQENAEASVLISPDMLQAVREKKPGAEPAPVLAPLDKPSDFARTSEDQRGKRPDKPMFQGERDTQATSDKAQDPNAPPLPSQKGVAPRDAGDLETTESRYRDGALPGSGDPSPAPPVAASPPQMPAPPPVPAEPTPPAQDTAPPAPPSEGMKELADKASPEVPEMKELLQGPNPIDVNVPKPAPEKSLPPPPPAPMTPTSDQTAKVTPDEKPPTPPKATPKPGDPGFSGHQRKTAIQGSISRTGRSALDVIDSPLGRYQATISRAVEKEWQLNCVKHRDFITPGFLTVRFFVESSGKVKSVQFVGEMQTGEIQKGFTLNSIRDADIPAMPKEIRADFKDESLELIFNFYF